MFSIGDDAFSLMREDAVFSTGDGEVYSIGDDASFLMGEDEVFSTGGYFLAAASFSA